MAVRITLCAKDISIIYGCSERTAHRMINAIRDKNKVDKKTKITVYHFADYTKTDAQHIIMAINQNKSVN